MNRSHLSPLRPGPRLAVLSLTLVFWAISLWHVDRFPAITADESIILSPGYKLFTQGVYGSDQLTGLYGMETHMVQFMPLMPLLQGLMLRLLGVGVYQARLVPVMAGVLTVVLLFQVTARLTNDKGCALLALVLLLFWQWLPAGGDVIGTGIPLVDMARIPRYDILTAPLGLLALWHFMGERTTGRLRYDFLCGLFVGLAGLAHIYGLFWGAAIGVMLVGTRRRATHPLRHTRLLVLGSGMLITLLPWLIFVFTHRNDFFDQQLINPQRFALGDPHFYINNLLNEPYRYFTGARHPSTLTRAGFWLLFFGAPATVITQAVVWLRKSDPRVFGLLVLTTVIPLLFGCLLQPKTVLYLPTLAVVWSMAVAWLLSRLLHVQQRPVRQVVTLCVATGMAVVTVQGLVAIGTMQARAAAVEPAGHFLAQIRQHIPTGARVLGAPQYWYAVPEEGYRSFALLFFLTQANPRHPPVSFAQALTWVAPDYLLLEPRVTTALTDYTTLVADRRSDEFWTYMELHEATLIAVIPDPYGIPISIYRLNP